MKEKILKNWREIIGWIIIFTFIYFYLFKINNLDFLRYRRKAFDFLVISVIFILAGLKLNERKN